MLILTSERCRGLSRTRAWSHTETQSNGRGQFWQQDSEKWQEAREHKGRAKNSWKIPNAEAGEFAGSVSQLSPAATSWSPLNLSFPFANLLGIARTHFGSLTQVFCGPLENWYALSPPCSTELSLHRGQGLGENENCSGRLPSTLEAHFAPQSWQSVSGRWAPQKCKLTVCFYAFRPSLKRACWPNRTTHSSDPKGGTLSFEDEHCTMLKLQR